MQKIRKGLLLFVEEGVTVVGDYYLKMLKKHLYVIKRLPCGQKSLFSNTELVTTQQIVLPIISMKMSLIISERKIDLLILVTSVYLIMQFGT